jgi:hypothetical protein
VDICTEVQRDVEPIIAVDMKDLRDLFPDFLSKKEKKEERRSGAGDGGDGTKSPKKGGWSLNRLFFTRISKLVRRQRRRYDGERAARKASDYSYEL